MTEPRMTNAEAVVLCRMAKAACPQQAFDAYTPDAWFELLNDLRFQDAKDAMIVVVKAQPFVSPAEIREQVAKLRRQRILEFGYVVPPAELADNPEAESRWMYETTQAIADGRLKKGDEPERPQELLARVMPDWDRMLPAPSKVTGSQVVAESRRVKSPEHAARLEAARAELANVVPAHPDADLPPGPTQPPSPSPVPTEGVSL